MCVCVCVSGVRKAWFSSCVREEQYLRTRSMTAKCGHGDHVVPGRKASPLVDYLKDIGRKRNIFHNLTHWERQVKRPRVDGDTLMYLVRCPTFELLRTVVLVRTRFKIIRSGSHVRSLPKGGGRALDPQEKIFLP